ncbi:crotonase/enoyl-CoA hydratase family protein [Sandaracinus amylolyticus]|uniref:Enoyl-CoA hydratase n=1 Tax=Sandaracinus amylolyticus TaxID=927083 RepID=A0A0F6SHW8_9BACT|nr:crotonase/enoyl-CoA hydratase family protein [Sandaracinus amylolyticus]AKF11169.1 Enoyl-CoA hydratase [Sandaracinus amylolyticus]
MSEARVVTTITDHVAHVRLNRPDKRNGLDLAMFEAIVAAGQQVIADRSVRAVVLSGEGKAFCAGLDWMAFLQMGADAAQTLLSRDEQQSPANLAQRVGWIWTEVPVPVIAAVHGVAFGGGLQIALGADLRIVSPDAQLSVMEIKYGLIPDMGASKTLLRVVRHDIAKELTYTGRVVGAEEAVRIGLATRVETDPLAAAIELARTIASQSPHAIRAGKALLDQAPALSTLDAFRLESDLQVGLLGSPNQMEAVQAVMAKRAASFRDPE